MPALPLIIAYYSSVHFSLNVYEKSTNYRKIGSRLLFWTTLFVTIDTERFATHPILHYTLLYGGVGCTVLISIIL